MYVVYLDKKYNTLNIFSIHVLLCSFDYINF